MSDTESKTTIEIFNAVCVNPSRWKPWHTFIYIDSVQYLADNIFEKYGIHPRGWREMPAIDSAYSAIRCRIRKRSLSDFLMAMEELQRKMIICGYSDYEAFCRKIIDALGQEDDTDDD